MRPARAGGKRKFGPLDRGLNSIKICDFCDRIFEDFQRWSQNEYLERRLSVARLRSPPCESNGFAACGTRGADEGDSNPRPPHENVLKCPSLQYAVRTLCGVGASRQPSVAAGRGRRAQARSAGASPKKILRFLARSGRFWTLAASAGAQRRKRVRRKFCGFSASDGRF